MNKKFDQIVEVFVNTRYLPFFCRKYPNPIIFTIVL